VDDIKVSRCRVGRARCLVGGMVLAALAVPAWAQEDVLGQMDRQVAAIVRRVGPSVVSIRVGPRGVPRPAAPGRRGGRAGSGLSLLPVSPATTLFAGNDDNAGGWMTAALGCEPSRMAMLGGPQAMALFQSARVGTGFVIDGDGIILTTADVVGNSDQVVVKLAEGRELDGKVLGADAESGVAVVKVADTKLPPLHLAEKEGIEPGQWAIIVGNQLDMTHTVWVGTVARTDVTFSAPFPQGRLLQIHAPVGPGASGAPVLNAKGDVVGVVVATSNPAMLRLGDASATTGAQFKTAMEGLRKKIGKADPENQRRIERITEAAAKIAERAAERARQLSERITERATQLGEQTAARAQSLRERYETDVRRAIEEKHGSEEGRERLDADLERLGQRLEAELDRLGEELDRQLERELKPLEKELDRQLEQDLKPLEDELEKLSESLPSAHGVREIALDLGPEVARVVASAHQIADTAVAAALAAAQGATGLASPPVPASPEIPPVPAVPSTRKWIGRTPGQGASTFAIPANIVHSVVVQIRELGHVSHAYLGVRLETLKPEDRERLKAPPEARVRVRDVFPDSPAQEAGVQKDDLILELQGKKLQEATDLTDLMTRSRAGERVSLVIWRGGERRTLQATLRERPQRAFAFAFPQAPMIITPQPFPQPGAPRAPEFHVQPPRSSVRTFVRVLPSGHVAASAAGSGRDARVTLEAQDAELESVLRELSRATQLRFTTEGEAAHQRVTLKVEGVAVDDLVESLARLYHLRSERQGDRITFRPR
jgi:S1-C subfamily serine protease